MVDAWFPMDAHGGSAARRVLVLRSPHGRPSDNRRTKRGKGIHHGNYERFASRPAQVRRHRRSRPGGRDGACGLRASSCGRRKQRRRCRRRLHLRRPQLPAEAGRHHGVRRDARVRRGGRGRGRIGPFRHPHRARGRRHGRRAPKPVHRPDRRQHGCGGRSDQDRRGRRQGLRVVRQLQERLAFQRRAGGGVGAQLPGGAGLVGRGGACRRHRVEALRLLRLLQRPRVLPARQHLLP